MYHPTLRLLLTTALAHLVACASADALDLTTDDEVLDVEPADMVLEEKADSASPGNVELKVTLASAQIAKARSLLKLTEGKAERREVTFYDTKALALSGAGLVLRSRKVIDGPDDSTVKLRPLEASTVASSWFKVAGFKCEEDWTPSKAVASCSLTVGQDQGEIDDVRNGKRAVDKLFSGDQEAFASTAKVAVQWSGLAVLGPTAAMVWKVKVKGFEASWTVEQWTLPDGQTLLEVSTRVAKGSAPKTATALTAWLSKRGLDATAAQETKTQAALAWFAAR